MSAQTERNPMLESEHENLLGLDKRVTVLETEFAISSRMARVEIQNARIVADIESEKGTRVRINSQIDADLRALASRVLAVEKSVWMGVGIIVAVQSLLAYFLRH